MLEVIALDLEGTLISNAMSQIPRPGLYNFLVGCNSIAKRVVVFTTVREEKFRPIAQLLVKERMAPAWFEHIEYVNWNGKTKDLTFIKDSTIENSVLVDDFHIYVHPGQEKNWIEIGQFEHPYPSDDVELNRVLDTLKNLTN